MFELQNLTKVLSCKHLTCVNVSLKESHSVQINKATKRALKDCNIVCYKCRAQQAGSCVAVAVLRHNVLNNAMQKTYAVGTRRKLQTKEALAHLGPFFNKERRLGQRDTTAFDKME